MQGMWSVIIASGRNHPRVIPQIFGGMDEGASWCEIQIQVIEDGKTVPIRLEMNFLRRFAGNDSDIVYTFNGACSLHRDLSDECPYVIRNCLKNTDDRVLVVVNNRRFSPRQFTLGEHAGTKVVVEGMSCHLLIVDPCGWVKFHVQRDDGSPLGMLTVTVDKDGKVASTCSWMKEL